MKLAPLFLLFLSFSSENESKFQLPKYAEKKIHTTIDKYWPDSSMDLVQNEKIIGATDQLTFDPSTIDVYNISSDDVVKGYMIISEGRSKFDSFDFMVIFKPDMTILTAKVLVYREDYGGEITSKRWLAQFDDKSSGSQMKLGQDIQVISGATISCRSMTEGVKDLSVQIIELKDKGLL